GRARAGEKRQDPDPAAQGGRIDPAGAYLGEVKGGGEGGGEEGGVHGAEVSRGPPWFRHGAFSSPEWLKGRIQANPTFPSEQRPLRRTLDAPMFAPGESMARF